MKMLHVRRDVLLMVLTIATGSFAALVVSIANRSNWNVAAIVWNTVVLLLLLFIIWGILKGMQITYEQEDTQWETKNKQLIKDTVQETLKELSVNDTNKKKRKVIHE